MSIEKPPANKPKVRRILISIEKPPANSKVWKTLMSIEKLSPDNSKVRRTLMSIYVKIRNQSAKIDVLILTLSIIPIGETPNETDRRCQRRKRK